VGYILDTSGLCPCFNQKVLGRIDMSVSVEGVELVLHTKHTFAADEHRTGIMCIG
jgi:hypothetical protein